VLSLFALAVRVAVARSLASEPLFRAPQLDALEYLRWARLIAGGEFPWPVPPPHGLGYPVFLAGVLRLVGGSLDGARLAQAALGAGTVVLTGVLAARTFGRRAGWAAGALLAVMGPVVFTEVSFLGEGLLLFLLVAALVAGDVAGGLLLGAAVLVRPTALVALPALIWKRHPAAMARALFGCLVVIVPVVVRISLANGVFVPVQGYGGLNFHIGNDLSGDGTASRRLGGDWEALQASSPDGRAAAARDRSWYAKTFAEWRSRPLDAAHLLASKAAWMLSADEIRDSHSFAFFAARSALLRWLPGFGLLLALAAIGIAGVDGGWRAWSQTSLGPALVALVAVPILLVVGSRYRLPVVPLLAVAAGQGVVLLLRSGHRRHVRRVAVLVGIGALAWGATQLRRHAPSHDLREEWALSGNALETLGESVEAEAAYRRAIEPTKDSGTADSPAALRGRKGLGRLFLETGRLADADRLYADLVRTHAADGDAWVGLARVRGAQGRPIEGLALAERATEVSPRLVDGWVLNVALATTAGEPARARRALERLADLLGAGHPLVEALVEALAERSGSRAAQAPVPSSSG
jgi:tetratricopeptide (TPR) repeat protein